MTLNKKEIKSLIDRLYNVANEIVGHVGESTDTDTAITGERYIAFYIKAESLADCERKWIMLIKSYLYMVKSQADVQIIDPTLRQIKIYWRTIPELTDNNRRPISDKHCGEIQLYARFLISVLTFSDTMITR